MGVISVPKPTTDVAQAFADLASTGLAVVADVLVDDQLAGVRDAVYREADADIATGERGRFEADFDDTNQRVWNLPNRDPIFLDLVQHPLAMRFVREVIGWPALLSNISANITGPGGGEMYLHCDQIYMPQPWSGVQGINVVWCLDDFTEENGATRIVPFSHRTPNVDLTLDTVPLEAPAGSVVVFDGRLWHKTGTNRTADQCRAGIFAWYTPPIYLPQENWWLALDPSVVERFDTEELLTLFGYKVGGFGRVYGRSPR